MRITLEKFKVEGLVGTEVYSQCIASGKAGVLVSFILPPLLPMLADGMLEMLATGQEAHQPGAWTAGVSFTNSLLQCTDPSFSLLL